MATACSSAAHTRVLTHGNLTPPVLTYLLGSYGDPLFGGVRARKKRVSYQKRWQRFIPSLSAGVFSLISDKRKVVNKRKEK
jgi:hypothetical protein